MRTYLNAAVRAAFSYLLLPLAVLIWICGLSATAHGQESHTFDGKTFVLRGARQLQVAAIAFNDGKAVITIDPDHRYQWGHLEGEGEAEGTRVERDYYEVLRDRIRPPARRATKRGWRSPLRLELYGVPLTHWTGPEQPDGRAFLDVRTNASGDFLIVVTTIHKAKATP